MKKEISFRWLAVIAMMTTLAPASAQDSLKTQTLNEVVITATKFPKNASETGKVVTVITAEQLSRKGRSDMAQVLNEQAGLLVNGANSNPAKDKSVYVRGASNAYTLVMVDGIPVQDPSGVGGVFDLRLLPFTQIDRIEIVKGSQSTLYGTDAIAGVINIITKDKELKPFSASAEAAYGSFNTQTVRASVGGTTRWADYAVSYGYSSATGISEAADSTGAADYERDGLRQQGFRSSVTFKPGKQTELKPFFQYTLFDGDYDAGAFADDPSSTYTSDAWHYGLQGVQRFSKGSINLLASVTDTERTYLDAFSTPPFEGRFLHLEAFMNYKWNDHVQVLGGIAYQLFGMEDLDEVSIVSPYASVFTSFSGFSTEIAARMNHHSVYGSNFTWSLNPSYLLNKRTKLFANYSTGFKAPTLSQLYGPFGANPDLKPETSWNGELGAQLFTVDTRLDFRMVGFIRNISQAIVYTTQYENRDELQDSGLEVEGNARAGKFQFTGNYMFVNGKLSTGGDLSETNLLRRPKHSGNFSVLYAPSEAFTLRAGIQYIGKRHDVFFNVNDYSSRAVVLNPATLLQVYAEYHFYKTAKVFVDVRNLTNTPYFESYGYQTQPLNGTVGIAATF